MGRALVAGTTAALLVGSTAGAAQAGTSPGIYHTIGSTHGYAAVVTVDGCETTELYVSSSTAMYASQPGPVNKQGLTGVFVRITDTCAAVPLAAPAAGGGGTVVFEADGQNLAPLVVDPRLTTGGVHTTIEAQDGEGNPVTLVLDATWTGAGPLEHTTVHVHDRYPGEGVVSSTANDRRRAAVADVSVSVAGRSLSGTTSDAVLERSRSRCVEVARPGVEGFYPCFGFPG